MKGPRLFARALLFGLALSGLPWVVAPREPIVLRQKQVRVQRIIVSEMLTPVQYEARKQRWYY